MDIEEKEVESDQLMFGDVHKTGRYEHKDSREENDLFGGPV